MLSGKKTYMVAAIALVVGILGFILNQVEYQQVVSMCLLAITFIALRAGTATNHNLLLELRRELQTLKKLCKKD